MLEQLEKLIPKRTLVSTPIYLTKEDMEKIRIIFTMLTHWTIFGEVCA